MINILNMFNNLDLSSKVLIGIIFILVIMLAIVCIILACKNDSPIKTEVDLDFFDELKKDNDNSKSIFVDTKEKEVTKIEEPKEEKTDTKVDIKSISEQIEKDIEKNNIELTEFEVEQEEKAIISYAELIQKVKSNDLTNVNVQTVDLDDRGYNLENEFTFDTEVLDFEDLLSKTEEMTTLKSAEVEYSSVNHENPAAEMLKQTDIKSILDIDDVDDIIYDSNEFLNALKELRDSLQ